MWEQGEKQGEGVGGGLCEVKREFWTPLELIEPQMTPEFNQTQRWKYTLI